MRRTTLRIGTPLAALLGCLAACASPAPEASRSRPHILLIVADDLGWSDLGAYGSEIPTPHLDALARSGLLATDFTVSCRGGPTRAMLLTGVDNHVAGFGISGSVQPTPEQEGRPAYAKRLSQGVVTVASLLRDAGYHTAMAGKWALGGDPENRPRARGFERSFVLHDGAASHWGDMRSAIPRRERAHYTRDGEDVDALPADYFSSAALTDFLVQSLGGALADGRPFFAYLSFQAPHGPLADEGREDFGGRYDAGYDAIRSQRLLRMKRLNLVREDVQPYPGLPTVPSWSDLSEQERARQARKMELYASMVAGMDFHVGRLLAFLEDAQALDDTVIFFLSDSGPEPGDRGLSGMDERHREWFASRFPEHELARWGREGSFVEYGPAWAQVSSVPFRLFKGTLAEGGIRSPLIVSGPGVEGPGLLGGQRVVRDLLHVTDLTPTFLELAGVSHPQRFRDRAVAPLQGRSLVGLLRGGDPPPDGWHGYAYARSAAVRRGVWKLVRMPPPFGVGSWRLFRLDHDPSERFDLAEQEPERVEALERLWSRYAEANGVVLPVAEEAQNPSPSDR